MQKASRKCVVCGADFFTPPSSNKKSCGKEACHIAVVKLCNTKHGESNTRLHNIWCGMKSRAKGKGGALARKYYADVEMCSEWERFENFRDWSLANGYEDHLEIDRRDNTKGYSPDNCRWATRKQQMQNTRVRRQKNKTSAYRGVVYVSHCNRKWRAQGCIRGKPKHIGLFETEAEAAAAYDKWAKAEFGEFASLNFKEE